MKQLDAKQQHIAQLLIESLTLSQPDPHMIDIKYCRGRRHYYIARLQLSPHNPQTDWMVLYRYNNLSLLSSRNMGIIITRQGRIKEIK